MIESHCSKYIVVDSYEDRKKVTKSVEKIIEGS